MENPDLPPASSVPPVTPGAPVISKEERTWAMVAHLSGFAIYISGIGHLVGPLIVWLAKRDGNPFVEEQAREALNFQISFTIYAALSALLIWVFCVGVFLLSALSVFHTVCMIIGAIKANDGVAYRYPLNLRLVSGS